MQKASPQLEGQRANAVTVGFSVPAQKQSATTAGSGITTGNGNAGKTFTDVPAKSSGIAELLSTVDLQEKLAYGTMTFKRQRAGDDFHFQISFAPSNRVGCNDIAFIQAVKSTGLPRKLKKHAAPGGATIDQSEAQLSPFYTVDSSLFGKREDKGPGLPHKPTTGIPGKGGEGGWPAAMLDAPFLPSTAAVFESCAICRGDGSPENVGSVYGCVLWMFVGNEEGYLDPARIPMTYFAERESRDFVTAGAAWNKWRRKHGRFGTREAMPELHAPPAGDVWASQNKSGQLLQRKCSCDGACDDCGKKKLHRATSAGANTPEHVPAIVHDVLRSSGRPLDSTTRRTMEAHFAHDFSSVRTHSGAEATASARAVGAEAYTAGRHIVFGSAPITRHILAHELAHVVQNGGGDQTPTDVGAAHGPDEVAADRAAENFGEPTRLSQTGRGIVRRYRSKRAFNFGATEEEFVDAKKQPWIEKVDVHFKSTTIDTKYGQTIPTGTATAHYAANNAKLADFSLPVAGGNPWTGLTDRGTFSVHRIEGIGYSDRYLPEGEGPHNKYAKVGPKGLSASMHYAVFFHGGQALHQGPLMVGSHGCVHFDERIQKINYHSVQKGQGGVTGTKVEVSYDTAALAEPCCQRMEHLGITRKGGALNPCDKADPKACPQASPAKGGGR